jgi:hypothetical protein
MPNCMELHEYDIKLEYVFFVLQWFAVDSLLAFSATEVQMSRQGRDFWIIPYFTLLLPILQKRLEEATASFSEDSL